jgi:polar amino acid transport system substrate-binding protein
MGSCQSQPEITDIEQLARQSIGVQTGNIADKMVLSRFPNAKIVYFVKPMDAVLSVINGKIAAFAADALSLEYIAGSNDEVSMLPGYIVPDYYGFAVRLGDDALKAAIDATLAEIKRDGTYEAMRARWFPKSGEPEPMPDIPLTGENGTLVFGTCSEQMPFSFVDNNRKPAGFDVEIATYVAKRLGMKLEIVDMEFGALITSLEAGKVDMIGASISITEERKKRVLFSDSYYSAGLGALVKAPKAPAPERIKKLYTRPDDLATARIGAMTGSIGETTIRERYPNADLRIFDDIMDAVAALKAHQIDAVITLYTTALNAARNNPDLDLLPGDLTQESAGVVASKQRPELLADVNRVLSKLKADGTLDDMVRRWILEDYREQEPVEIPMPPSGPTLKVGVAANRVPVEFVAGDGTITGLDPELACRIAAGLGMRVEFHDMKFAALINALESGKVDLIIANMTRTEERARMVDFSEPYFSNPNRFLIRKEDDGSSLGLAVPEDVNGKTVGVFTGSAQDAYISKTYPQAKVFRFNTLSKMENALKSGTVDALMYSHEVFLEAARLDETLGLLGGPVFSIPIGMGFSQDNTPLCDQFNHFLRELRSGGTYEDIVDRWMNRRVYEIPAIVNDGRNGSLAIGIVSDVSLPFAAQKDGRPIGFDIEIAERFAAYVGKKPVFLTLTSENLAGALSTGEVDMIAASMFLSEEGDSQPLLSEPYYEMGASFLALKKNLAAYEGARAPIERKSFFERLANSFYINIILENRYLLILSGLRTTLVISVLACLFGTALGAGICALRMSKNVILRWLAKVYISVIRGMPVLVLLMLIFYVIFASVNIDPVLVAVIAFGMNFGAYVSEMFRASIEGIDKGQREAGWAGGFTKLQTFRYILLPQALKSVLPVYKGEFISLVKITSIVGYIAVQDLTKASDIIRSRTFDAFFPLIMVAVLYFLLSGVLIQILSLVEVQVDPKARRKAAASVSTNPIKRAWLRYKPFVYLILFAVVVLAALITPLLENARGVSEGPIRSLADLEGRRVCVITGTTGDIAMKRLYKNVKYLDIVYIPDAVLAMKKNKADAFVFDKNSLKYVLIRNEEFVMLPGEIDSVDIGIPIKKGNTTVLNEINESLRGLQESGMLSEMYRRWFEEDWDTPPPLPDLPTDGKNGVLRMGTCSLTEPFGFVHNGQIVGHDIELGHRLAHALDKRLEIMDMTFDAIIPALESGKIDIAIANYYLIEDRAAQVDFSIPYMKAEIGAIVRRDAR